MYILERWNSCHKDFFICISPLFLLNPSYFPLQRVGLHTTELEKQQFETLEVRQKPLVTIQDRKITHSQCYFLSLIHI